MAAAAPCSTVVGAVCRRAKRARTELADPPPPDALSATNTNWRDWANLTAGPAGLIVERILADDVATYLRFRAVCASWRRSTLSPRVDILDRRFHPRRWIMLPEVFATQVKRRDFMNVLTGERIRVDIPGLRYQFVFGHTFDGLILLCQKGTGAVRLLNPLTRQLTTLPNATSLLCSPNNKNSTWISSSGSIKLKEIQAFSAGLANSSTLALHFQYHELAVAKPNDERWSRCSQYMYRTYSTLYFANRFYCFTDMGLMVVDITDAKKRPQLAMAVKVDKDFCCPYKRGTIMMAVKVNLVDNDGQMILVRQNFGLNYPKKYDVYLVDLDEGKMVPMIGLHGRALFVCHFGAGSGHALSVHAGLSASISANTIYECTEIGEGAHCNPRISAYDLWREEWTKENFYACQGSIVDYLSRYICRSEDIVLPAPVLSPSVGAVVSGPWKRKRMHKASPKIIGSEWVN